MGRLITAALGSCAALFYLSTHRQLPRHMQGIWRPALQNLHVTSAQMNSKNHFFAALILLILFKPMVLISNCQPGTSFARDEYHLLFRLMKNPMLRHDAWLSRLH
jgi:hypothetical protein